MTGRLKSIDMIRAFAAAAVVLHHALGGLTIGMIGVDFFFVVSGFVIFHSARGRTSGDFLTARLWRIFPIYWIAAAPWLASSIIRGTMTPGRMAEQVLLLPLWWTTHLPLLFVAWTLTFECLFYAAAAVSIRLRSSMPMLILFGAAMAAWGLGGSQRLVWLGNPMILEFLMGVGIALAPKDRRAGLAALIAGGMFLLLFPTTAFSTEFREFAAALSRVGLWGIPAALIVYGAITFEKALHGRLVALLCAIGGASYSIYLFHPLITEFHQDWPWWLRLIGAFSIGIAAWAIFERPLLRIRPRKAWWRRRDPAPTRIEPA